MHAQAVATQLMIELCGARVAPGTIDIGWRRAAGAARSRLREARVQAILGVAVALERQAEILGALDFASRSRRADGLEVTRARAAPRRRHARDRPDRGGRADRRPRAPARDAARAPRRRRQAQPRPARAPRAPRTRWSAAACTRSSAGASPTPPCSTACCSARRAPAAPRGDAREPAVGRAVDHAPDAARLAARRRPPQRRAQRPRHRDLRVGHRLPGAPRRRRRGHARRRAPRLGVLLSGALAPRSWRGERREADFFAAKALLEALLDALPRRLVGERPPTWPFLHPGRSAAVLARRGDTQASRASSASCTRWSRRAWDLRAHGRVRDRPRQARRGRARGRRVRAPSAPFPPLRQDLAVTLPESVSAAELAREPCARPPARRSRTRACSTSTPASRSGRGGARSRSRCPSARSTRTLTDEDIAPAARARSSPRSAQIGGELRG